MVRRSWIPAWPALLLVGCQQGLVLPAQPSPDQPPRITGLEPKTAYTGARIVISGENLGGLPDRISVRFGTAQAVHPDEVDGQGGFLAVRVPADAVDGRVRVTTAAGEALSEDRFTFAGLGYPRYGRVSRQYDMRPIFQPYALEPAGTFLLTSTLGAPVLVQPDGTHRVLAEAAEPDVAAFDEGRGLILANGMPVPGCDGLSLDVYRDLVPTRTVCLPTGYGWVGGATNDSGTLVQAVSGDAAWLLDLSTSPPTHRVWQAGDKTWWPSPAWLGGSRFVFVEDSALRMVEQTASGPVLHPAAPVPGVENEDRLFVAARDGQIAVVAGVRVVLLDAASWPPTVRATFPSLSAPPALPLLSDDLRRLHLASWGKVLTFDLTRAPPVPLGLAEVGEDSWAARPGRLGTFLVGVQGGWATLLQETGALLERRLVDAELLSPHRIEMQDDDYQGTRAAVALSRTLEAVFFLEEKTLGIHYQRAAAGAQELAARPEPGKQRFFLRAGTRVWRRDCASHLCEADGWEWQAPEGTDVEGSTHLALMEDSSALLLAYRGAGGGGRVAVLDTARKPGAGAPVLSLAEPVLSLAVGAGRAVLLTRGRRILLDVAATLRDGTPRVVREQNPGPIDEADGVRQVVAGPEFFLEFQSDRRLEDRRFVRLLRAADAEVLAELPLPRNLETYGLGSRERLAFLQVSPGGRRAWWVGSGLGQERLISMSLDPENGTIGYAEPPVILSDVNGLLPSADGQSLFVAHRSGGLTLIE